MAKRKRLGGPLQDYLATTEHSSNSCRVLCADRTGCEERPPSVRPFEEVSRELSSARSEGRLVLRLPLDSIETAWLMRDRTHPGTAEDPDFQRFSKACVAMVSAVRSKWSIWGKGAMGLFLAGVALQRSIICIRRPAMHVSPRFWLSCGNRPVQKRLMWPWSRKTRSGSACPITSAHGLQRNRWKPARTPPQRRLCSLSLPRHRVQSDPK